MAIRLRRVPVQTDRRPSRVIRDGRRQARLGLDVNPDVAFEWQYEGPKCCAATLVDAELEHPSRRKRRQELELTPDEVPRLDEEHRRIVVLDRAERSCG